MVRRSVRLLVLLAAIALTGVAGWRATVNEQRRAALRSEAASSDTQAAETLDALADLRASLYAYVAPGQGYVNFLPQFGLGAVGGWIASLIYAFGLAMVMFIRWHSAAWKKIRLQ